MIPALIVAAGIMLAATAVVVAIRVRAARRMRRLNRRIDEANERRVLMPRAVLDGHEVQPDGSILATFRAAGPDEEGTVNLAFTSHRDAIAPVSTSWAMTVPFTYAEGADPEAIQRLLAGHPLEPEEATA